MKNSGKIKWVEYKAENSVASYFLRAFADNGDPILLDRSLNLYVRLGEDEFRSGKSLNEVLGAKSSSNRKRIMGEWDIDPRCNNNYFKIQ